MTFSLSGSTITQTGTDVIEAGTVIPGTTKTTVRGSVTEFDFGGNLLVVNGALTIGEKRRFINLTLGSASTGTLNVGELQANPTDYQYCDGMDALQTVDTGAQTFANLKLNVYGQRIFLGSTYLSLNKPFQFEHAHVVVRGRFNMAGAGYIVRNTRITNTPGNINSCTFVLANTAGWDSVIFDSEIVTYFSLSNLTPVAAYTFENISLASGQALMSYGQEAAAAPGPTFNVYQLSVGASYSLINTVNRYYILNLYQRFTDTLSDTGGNPVQGVVVHLDGGAGTAIQSVTDSVGQTAQAFLYHSNTLTAGVEARTQYLSGNTITKRICSFLHLLPAASSVDVRTAAPSVASRVLVDDPALAVSIKATVDAYTTLETASKLYDRAKSWLVDNYTGQAETLVSRSGTLIDAGSYNVTIDATAAQAFAVAGSTITIKASTYTGGMTTTGVITLANGAEFVGTRTDANGTVAPPKTVSITGITAGSRLQIYNVTTASEVVNTVVAGTSYSATYLEGTGYSEGDTVRVRLAYDSGATAKLPFTGQAIVGSTGWALLANQQDDVVYNALAIDGSAVTEFVEDFPNIQVDINDPDGSTRVDMLYAWFVHAQSGEEGIRQWFGGIVPEDEANFRVVTAVLNLKIDNVAATGVTFTDGRRLYRDDNASPLVASTTGGGSITFFAGKVYTSIVSTASPVITGDIADVGPAVRANLATELARIDATVSSREAEADASTRQAATLAAVGSIPAAPSAVDNAAAVLAAATSTPIAANVAQVTGVAIAGTGTEADPWGPGA